MVGRFLVAALSLAGAATAALPESNSHAIARIAWGHEAKSRLIAGDRLWRCVGDSCHGQVLDRPNSRIRTCRQLARTGGEVISFQVAGVEISSIELERCNRGVSSGRRS